MTAIPVTVAKSTEDRLGFIRQAVDRFARGSANLQSELAEIVDKTGRLGGPLAWLRGQVNEQQGAQRATSGMLSGIGASGLEATLPVLPSHGGTSEVRLPVSRLDETVRPTLERALEQSRALAALDSAAWALPGEETPVLAAGLVRVQAIFGQLIHSLLSMPSDRDRQIHWAEGTRAFLDEVEGKLALLVQRSRELTRETALRADWFSWVREVVRAGINNEKPASNLVDRLDCLVREMAETGHLGVDLAKVWWQPVPGEKAPEVWVAADGWNLAWTAAEVARLEGVGPQALSASETLHSCLLHDIGMAFLPGDLWITEALLAGEQRKALEAHASRGEALVAQLMPERHGLRKAVLWHHERADGTGYPDGHKGPELSPLSGWLAVLDVYAGLQMDRAHRPAVSPVDAWRTVHAWARQGLLESSEAARLNLLGPLPIGTLIKMADGALALSAGCVSQADVSSAWVVPLTNSAGQPLAVPQSPKTIDPRTVGGIGRSDVMAFHGLDRKALLRETCPWLG